MKVQNQNKLFREKFIVSKQPDGELVNQLHQQFCKRSSGQIGDYFLRGQLWILVREQLYKFYKLSE